MGWHACTFQLNYKLLENSREVLLYISTWEVIKQWLSCGRNKKRVSWYKFQSHIMWQWAGRTSVPGPHSEQKFDSINSLWGLIWHSFIFRVLLQVQDFFAIKLYRVASGCENSDITLRDFRYNFTKKPWFQQGLPRQ